MAESMASPSLRKQRVHDVGVALLVLLTAGLTFALEFMAWVAADSDTPVSGRDGAFAAVVFALYGIPLLLSLGAVAISLKRRPLWARWAAAIFILLVPAGFMFGVLNG